MSIRDGWFATEKQSKKQSRDVGDRGGAASSEEEHRKYKVEPECPNLKRSPISFVFADLGVLRF